MALLEKITNTVFFGKTDRKMSEALAQGLISRNGAKGQTLFAARLEKGAPQLAAAVRKVRKNGGLRELLDEYEKFLASVLDADIVDADFPAYRAGGIFKNSFPPVRMLRALAIFSAGADGAESLLSELSAADTSRHYTCLAYSRILLENKKYREAADAALEARRRLAYDYCCSRAVNDTQRALQENGHKPDYDMPQSDNSQRFCEMPFTYLNYAPVDDSISIVTSCCPANDWLPMAFELDSSWNNEDLQAVRASILDGSYKYCDEVRCVFLRDSMLPLRSEIADPYLRDIIDNNRTFLEKGPRTLILGYDKGCNLWCPSCRPAPYQNDRETTMLLDERMDKELMPILPGVKRLNISCYGEALASRHSRRILESLTPDKYPDLSIHLLTNLKLLSERTWEELGAAADCIKWISMSIDGGRPVTLEKLRRGLKWERMLDALAFAKELRLAGKLDLTTVCFMLQKDNYKELKDIFNLAVEYRIDALRIATITAHGCYSVEEFNDVNVCDPKNPLHGEAMEAVDELKGMHAQMMGDKEAILSAGGWVPRMTWRLA